MRAAIYARVSTTEQAEAGHSIDEQILAVERFCASKGWALAGQYVDRGVSGSTADRPELRRLLEDAQAGRFDVVVCHAVDRFYRNLQGLLKALDQLHQANVAFVSLTENLDFSTPWGKLTLAVLGSLAEIYLDKLSAETSKGKLGRARKGLSNASTTPHGYQRTEDGEDTIDPEAAEAVLVAFEAYASGLHSDQTVADLLNRAGYKPSGRARSGRWTREGVRYLLTNPFYIGEVCHGDDTFPGKHEPVVTRELWDQVQAVRARKSHRRGAGRTPDRVYLLARLARCSICGLKLVAQHSGGKGRRGTPTEYYQCPARRRSIACDVGGTYTTAADVDAQISHLVARLRLPDDWRERLEELAQHQEEAEKTEGKRRYLEDQLRRLRELYIDGDFAKGEYNRRRAVLQAELGALVDPEPSAIESAGETLETLGEVWEDTPKRLQAKMLKTIFEEVRVDVAARRLVSVKPWAPFVPLFRMDGLEEGEKGVFYV